MYRNLNDMPEKKALSPPIVSLEEQTKDIWDRSDVSKVAIEVCKAAIENLALKVLKLQGENEKLRGFVKDFVKTGPKNKDTISRQNVKIERVLGKQLDVDADAENELVAHKALSTSLILQKVFGYFDDLDLLKFRRVSKFWAAEASTRLLIFNEKSAIKKSGNKGRVQVRILYNRKENTLGKNGVGMLADLSSLMTRGEKFPCSHFYLACPNLLPNVVPDAVEFLEKFGSLIQSLILEFVSLESSPQTNRDVAESLRNLLFKWAPNIKYFHCKGPTWRRDDPGLLNDGVKKSSFLNLPYLRILNWEVPSASDCLIYRDILRISPNLKRILNYTPVKEVVQANKAYAIKDLQVVFAEPSAPPTPSNFSLISEHCVKVEEIEVKYYFFDAFDRHLKVLTIPEEWGSKVELLNKVLQNNRYCLNKIHVHNLGPLAECGLEIPVMPNLKTLEILTNFESNVFKAKNLDNDKFFRIFPKGLDVAETFPKLGQISWEIRDDGLGTDLFGLATGFHQIPILDTAGTLLTSVRSLTFTIVRNNNLEFLRSIAGCLPNVRVIKVNFSERTDTPVVTSNASNPKAALAKLFRIIWQLFQNLEEIHLVPYLKDISQEIFLNHNHAHLVDSAVTGLDLDTVIKLARRNPWEKSDSDGKSENVPEIPEQCREASSILNMKRLRYLKISMQSVNEFPIFTHVSGTHGFGLMSNLIVVIEAEGEKSSVIQDEKDLMSRNVKFYQLPRKR